MIQNCYVLISIYFLGDSEASSKSKTTMAQKQKDRVYLYILYYHRTILGIDRFRRFQAMVYHLSIVLRSRRLSIPIPIFQLKCEGVVVEYNGIVVFWYFNLCLVWLFSFLVVVKVRNAVPMVRLELATATFPRPFPPFSTEWMNESSLWCVVIA